MSTVLPTSNISSSEIETLLGKHTTTSAWTETFSGLSFTSPLNTHQIAYKKHASDTRWTDNLYKATFLFSKTQGSGFDYTTPLSVSLSGFIDDSVSIWLNINSATDGTRLLCYQLPVWMFEPLDGQHWSSATGKVDLTNFVTASAGTTFDFYIGAGPTHPTYGYYWSRTSVTISAPSSVTYITSPTPVRLSEYYGQDFDVESTVGKPIRYSSFKGAVNYDPSTSCTFRNSTSAASYMANVMFYGPTALHTLSSVHQAGYTYGDNDYVLNPYTVLDTYAASGLKLVTKHSADVGTYVLLNATITPQITYPAAFAGQVSLFACINRRISTLTFSSSAATYVLTPSAITYLNSFSTTNNTASIPSYLAAYRTGTTTAPTVLRTALDPYAMATSVLTAANALNLSPNTTNSTTLYEISQASGVPVSYIKELQSIQPFVVSNTVSSTTAAAFVVVPILPTSFSLQQLGVQLGDEVTFFFGAGPRNTTTALTSSYMGASNWLPTKFTLSIDNESLLTF